MTLEEAILRIQELETQLAEAKELRDRGVIREKFIEGSVDLLDIEVPFADFKKEDDTYHTINSFCANTVFEPIYNSDKTRFIFGWELSDLHNVPKGIKQLLTEVYGKELGGEDFTSVGDNKIWILTYTEKKEFLQLNPNWQTTEIN